MAVKESVDEFMSRSVHPLKKEIEALRTILKNSNPKIGERIKWNAPSYFFNDDMAAFNLRQTEFVQIIFVFPKGLIKDEDGILLGEWKDRREARFYSMEDITTKKAAIERLVNDWVMLMDQ